jgi:EAL domain-containing protein (putative c-di-GMP-specific phosphodiesterase class I)
VAERSLDIGRILAGESALSLVAQPIVDLRRAIVVGYELLARFKLETPVSPDIVFAEASRSGLGAELEAFVIERAFELAESVPANCFTTINVDPAHLIRPCVAEVIERQGPLTGIVFELTEHRAIEDLPAVLHACERLRKRGAMIAVDDAGSGYSGLRQILELRPQILKVDRELVSNLHEDDAKRALIQMLGELAGRLDAWLLAEGIELEAELSLLRQLGVPLAQGYFLGRPAPPFAGLTRAAQEVLESAPSSIRNTAMVYSLLEPAVLCREGEDWPKGKLAIRVGDKARPLAMRLVDAHGEHLRAEHELLRVKRESLLTAVAQRAATRVEALRWDPLLCTDDRGDVLGVVRMPRLVCALAEVDPTRRGFPGDA